MRLLIKQRKFSWSDTFDVYDEHGKKKYFVKGELISVGHKLHVFDNKGKEIGLIKQKLISMLPSFHIYINGEKVGHVQKKIGLFHPKFEVDYKKWDIDGDVMGWNYTVKNGRKKVAKITKELLRWGDTYVIKYDDPKDELMAMMLVIAIDAATCEEDEMKVER